MILGYWLDKTGYDWLFFPGYGWLYFTVPNTGITMTAVQFLPIAFNFLIPIGGIRSESCRNIS